MAVIAIPCRKLDLPGADGTPGAQGVVSTYLEAICQVGATAVLVPMQPAQLAASALMMCGGLLLAGGEDIAPAGTDAITVAGVDRSRDAHESCLLELALELRMPVLAICRGMQLLNVSRGGTIAQVAKVGSGSVRHVTDWRSGKQYGHPVRIDPGSLLGEILAGCSPLRVNGTHSLCLAVLGEGVRVAATAGDGVAEAIELADSPLCLGIQWHPEALVASDEAARRIFEWFVGAADQYEARRT